MAEHPMSDKEKRDVAMRIAIILNGYSKAKFEAILAEVNRILFG
jgi:hypothetical protein